MDSGKRQPWMRWLAVVCLMLLAPAIPLLGFGDRLDERVGAFLDQQLSPQLTAAVVIGVHVSDILLPVPSSLVSTLAGARLGILLGTLASWLGMNLGVAIGFVLGGYVARPLLTRFSSPQDLVAMETLMQRYGATALIVARPVPLLAEASVLLAGALHLGGRRFWAPVVLSNLAISLAYAILGRFAAAGHWLPVAMVASVALPLLTATMARQWLHARLPPRE